VSLLERIRDPRDVRALPPEQLPQLAEEIREFLVDKVSRTGGHLGPNLGVVELTIALHRVFRSPDDLIVWDTGHQAYVHKILTGRARDFDTLKQKDGLSGYPSRDESLHDIVENSHASTALSYADGIAKAYERRGLLGQHHVIAVIGDGALTGGMAWEALNNIAASDRPMIIVVNDNAWSYSPTIGGLAHHLSTLRTTRGYERFMNWGKRVLHRTPVVGDPIYGALHGMKKGVKDVVAPQGLFEDLGLKYIGPIDGHDEQEMEFALSRAKVFPGPVIVHAITQKGRGYAPAEQDTADHFHGVGIIDPETGLPVKPAGPTWTGAFADELVSIGAEREDVVAITAAMLGPTGLDRFAERFPERTYDVGIAEQHAATSAAGMAYGGLHPVVALYATFLNRAFDQVLMDCALHRAGVTFVLDRAGVTGDDGPSHNGMWDMAMLQVVPGLRIAAPRDEVTLRAELREAVAVADAPTVVRFPKGSLGPVIETVRTAHGCDVIAESGRPEVVIVAVGAFGSLGIEVAHRLKAQGIGVVVVDPRWVKPLPVGLCELAAGARLVVSLEDGVRVGGVGDALGAMLRDQGVTVPLQVVGVPDRFLTHGKRAEVLADCGLTAQEVSRGIVETMARYADAGEASAPTSQSTTSVADQPLG
jgi:1-deoxy-D-xylulose-5-phosphate synthase